MAGWDWTVSRAKQVSSVCTGVVASLFMTEKAKDAAVVRWQVESWRDAYCARDTHATNEPFDADRWRDGDPSARGAMARDLMCGASVYGLPHSQVLELLGPPVSITDLLWTPHQSQNVAIYRIVRDRPFLTYEPPIPEGWLRIPDTYDLGVVFDPVRDTVMWFDVLPAAKRSIDS